MKLNIYAGTLDEIDSKIVEMLSENGRMTDTEIAKKVGLSKTSVRLRKLKLLKSEKIKILGIPILRNLNLVDADVFVKFLINTPQNQIEALVSALLEEEHVYEINRYLYKYDLNVSVYHTSFALLKSYVQELFKDYKIIEFYDIFPVLQTDKAFGAPL
jgi:Lrp/AsnC family leucine-responsive transcriptional regulator